jgi:hypothetical protein
VEHKEAHSDALPPKGRGWPAEFAAGLNNRFASRAEGVIPPPHFSSPMPPGTVPTRSPKLWRLHLARPERRPFVE